MVDRVKVAGSHGAYFEARKLCYFEVKIVQDASGSCSALDTAATLLGYCRRAEIGVENWQAELGKVNVEESCAICAASTP